MLEIKDYDDVFQLDKDSGGEKVTVFKHKRKVARNKKTSVGEIKQPKQPKIEEKNPYQEAAERAAKSLAPMQPQGARGAFNRTMTNKGGMMNYQKGGKAKAGSQPMYTEVMPKAGPC